MDLLELLKGQMNDSVLEQLSNQVEAPKEQTAKAAEGIMATILGGLTKNAATSPEGLQGLMGALDRDHDGSVLDDIMGLIGGNPHVANPNAANGVGILKHVLGGGQQQAAEQVSQMSGLNMGQVMKLMPIIAPIVMGMLGKSRSNGSLDMSNILGVLLNSTQGAANSGMGGLLATVLGGMMNGGGNNQAQQQQQSAGGFEDLLGTILGGAQQQQQQQQQAQPQQEGGLLGNILGGLFK